MLTAHPHTKLGIPRRFRTLQGEAVKAVWYGSGYHCSSWAVTKSRADTTGVYQGAYNASERSPTEVQGGA